MTRKRFSIITPTLNAGGKLEETIQSVLSQQHELFEYIIVDGCSTDETLETIKKYPGRIKWVSEKDRGVYDAMNKGIELASGAYLYFLGAGDCLRPNILEKIDKEIPAKNLVFIYGNVYRKDRDRIYDGEFDKTKLTLKNISHQAIMYESTIFDLIGKYDLKYEVLADHVFNIKCFGDSRIEKIYLEDIIADYEGDGVSKHLDRSFRKDRSRIIRDNLGYKQLLLCTLVRVQQKLRLMVKGAVDEGRRR
jgi:glycosyltransferase involved in cell wall biosynthesis